MPLHSKIATAPMSREIFLVNACDGVTTSKSDTPSEPITISQPLAALFGEESLLWSQWQVLGSEFLGFQRRRSRWISILSGSVIVIYQGDFSTHRSCSDSYRFCHLACSHPRGSVSLDSRSPAAPYESSSLATARNDDERMDSPG